MLGIIRITVTLDDPGTGFAHGTVAATLRNSGSQFRKGLFAFIFCQEGIQGDSTGMEQYQGIFRTKEKPGRIHGIGIKEGEYRRHTLFQLDIGIGIVRRINEKNDMKPGPGRLFSLGLHMVAAVMNEIRYTQEETVNILCCNPRVLRLLTLAEFPLSGKK